MATVFKLYDGTNTVDLATDADWHLLRDYVPQVATPTGDGTIPPYIREEIPIRIKGTSADNLASVLQTLHLLQRTAAEYWMDPTQDTPVWFHCKLNAETEERRALVKAVELILASNPYAVRPDFTDKGIKGTLIVERHPYWERTASISMPEETLLSGAAIIYDPTSVTDIVGDVAARIKPFDVRSLGDPLNRFWIGLRSVDKHGTLGNFVEIWECEDGTNNPNESGVTDDAATDPNGASPGSAAGIFVKLIETDLNWDDEWHEVMGIRIEQVTANYDDNKGRFLWLLRSMVTSGTWEVQLRFGYNQMDDDTYTRGDIIEVSATTWNFHEMGQAMIPLHGARLSGDEVYDNLWEIQIWAQRTSGSGDLYLDCLCPLPIDEGYLIASNLIESGGAQAYLYYQAGPNDDVLVSSRTDMPEWSTWNFALPSRGNGDMRMIIVFARDSTSILTDDIQIFSSSEYYPRWLSLRGTE